MSKIKISFIIPVYNIKNYIEKCVDSILKQNDKLYIKEVIIVNDGSTDGVQTLLNDLENANPEIKVIHKENGGLSSARNAGLNVATGDYIWFVDGDDYIQFNSFDILNNYFYEDEYDIIYFNYYKDYEVKKIKVEDSEDYQIGSSKILINTSPCTKIFKREFLTNNKALFYEGIIYEDLELIPYLISKSKKDLFIKECLYNYVYRNGSIMNSNNSFNINRDDKFKSLRYLIEKFQREKTYEKYFSELEFLMIKHLLIVYSSEILIYNRDIYLKRCKNILKELDNIDSNWIKNKYFLKMSFLKKLYVYLFKNKCFYVCKIIMIILRKVGRL